MENSIFLTGGSGFVGRHFITYLRKQNHKVFALVRSNASANVVRELGAFAVPGNLYNHAALKNTMQLCQYVVHAAAYKGFSGDPKEFYTVNVEGTKAMLDAAAESNIQKFIYISDAVIVRGKGANHVDESFLPKKMPTDLYSETKYQAEQSVIDADSPTMRTIVLRPPFLWGPDNPYFDLVRDAIEQRQFRWFQHNISTCHVENLAAAVVAAVSSTCGGQRYFITDGQEHQFDKFFSRYAGVLGHTLSKKSSPRWSVFGRAYVLEFLQKHLNVRGTAALSPAMIHRLFTELTVNDQKARAELGYENVVSIEEGFERLHDPRLN